MVGQTLPSGMLNTDFEGVTYINSNWPNDGDGNGAGVSLAQNAGGPTCKTHEMGAAFVI